MAICENQLWDFVRSIEPSQSQKNGAVRSQNYLRDLLNCGQMASRIENSYLSGSYYRDTAIYPLDDVDIIFVVDPSYWLPRPHTIENIISTVFWGESPKFPSPSSVLQSFARAIRYRYPASSVFTQRRSVRLHLNHLDIDIVPAIQDQSDGSLIRIPDSHADRWILTSPRKHSENATAVNKFQNSKFKPLVKLLKHWNGNLPSTANFKSFAIETMAVRVFSSRKFRSLQEGLLQFFDFVAYVSGNNTQMDWDTKYGVSLTWLNVSIPDAAGTDSDVASGIDEGRRKRFVENAIRSRNRMRDSLNARSTETACQKVSEALRI